LEEVCYKRKNWIDNNTNIRLSNVNSNGKNVVANNPNHVNFFFLKKYKIEVKNNHHMIFFLKDAIITQKTKLLILSTSLMNIERINTFLVDMDLFYGIKKIKYKFEV
jgi:hypothetical protein